MKLYKSCGDSLTKKKLFQHRGKCRDAAFTCLDCSTTFYGNDFQQHTTCISEAEKYEKSLYKGNKKQQKKQQQQNGAKVNGDSAIQPAKPEANGDVAEKSSNEEKSTKETSSDALKTDLQKIVKKKSKPIKLSKIIKKLSEKTSLSEKDVLSKLVVLADSEGRISLQ